MRDAAHPAERQNERQDADVADDRRDEQDRVDADERRRLAAPVRVETVTELGDEPSHQRLSLVRHAQRRLDRHRSGVGDRCQLVRPQLHHQTDRDDAYSDAP